MKNNAYFEELERIGRDWTKMHEAHKELWQHNDTQDEKIADHETRIRVLEREV